MKDTFSQSGESSVWPLGPFLDSLSQKKAKQFGRLMVNGSGWRDDFFLHLTGADFPTLLNLLQQRTLYLGSSRLSKNWKNQKEIRLAIRAICQRPSSQKITLICPTKSPIIELVRFLSIRQGWNLVSVADQTIGLPRANKPIRIGHPNTTQVQLSISQQTKRKGGSKESTCDELCFTLADEVRLLSVRTSGKLDTLSQTLIDQPVYVLSSARNSRKKLASNASPNRVPWFVFGPPKDVPSSASEANLWPESFCGLWKRDRADPFLFHHTRGTFDPWPGEESSDFWEKWLQDSHRNGRPLQTLHRIILEQRLRAFGRLIPGKVPMVCFSENDPGETSVQPIFRKQLGRWDGLPFGVGVRKECLQLCDFKKVTYLENRSNQMTAEEKNPWTHPRYSFDRQGKVAVDWSEEREYRLMGDLNLRKLRHEDVIVFVQRRIDAIETAVFSRFPVYYLKEDETVSKNGQR